MLPCSMNRFTTAVARAVDSYQLLAKRVRSSGRYVIDVALDEDVAVGYPGERGTDLVDDALAVRCQPCLAARKQHLVDDRHGHPRVCPVEGDVLGFDLFPQRTHDPIVGRRQLDSCRFLSLPARLEPLLESGGALTLGGQLGR